MIRGQISEGTLRNWRSMIIGLSLLKIGKAILYPLEELDRWDRRKYHSLSALQVTRYGRGE